MGKKKKEVILKEELTYKTYRYIVIDKNNMKTIGHFSTAEQMIYDTVNWKKSDKIIIVNEKTIIKTTEKYEGLDWGNFQSIVNFFDNLAKK